jgi:hypothetical protein
LGFGIQHQQSQSKNFLNFKKRRGKKFIDLINTT